MKKYIQPTSEALALQMEAVIAASDFSINNKGTDASALSNDKGGWNCDDWSGEEEKDF